jgi:hypothetical protein
MQKELANNFIKGKIGEIVFDQMFREEGRFTVIPFGYERTLPEIAQYAKEAKYQQVVDNIRSAPDFALVSQNKKQVFLVEVKYRSKIDMEELKEVAEKIEDRWKLVWMFVCTPDGFYFDRTSKVIEKENLTPLKDGWVNKQIQDKYLDIVNKFIK